LKLTPPEVGRPPCLGGLIKELGVKLPHPPDNSNTACGLLLNYAPLLRYFLACIKEVIRSLITAGRRRADGLQDLVEQRTCFKSNVRAKRLSSILLRISTSGRWLMMCCRPLWRNAILLICKENKSSGIKLTKRRGRDGEIEGEREERYKHCTFQIIVDNWNHLTDIYKLTSEATICVPTIS
jgi:hypothetical protein